MINRREPGTQLIVASAWARASGRRRLTIALLIAALRRSAVLRRAVALLRRAVALLGRSVRAVRLLAVARVRRLIVRLLRRLSLAVRLLRRSAAVVPSRVAALSVASHSES